MQQVLGSPDGATLMRHFLDGTGTPFPPFSAGSVAAADLPKNPNFQSLDKAVLGEIKRQLDQGASTVNLNGFLLSREPPTLDSPVSGYVNLLGRRLPISDLYWAFRGTQGMTVSGSGSVNGNSYSGTLTYTILDTFGFSVADALNLPFKSGAYLRYLQVECGNDPRGARWFPDSISLTEPFSGQL